MQLEIRAGATSITSNLSQLKKQKARRKNATRRLLKLPFQNRHTQRQHTPKPESVMETDGPQQKNAHSKNQYCSSNNTVLLTQHGLRKNRPRKIDDPAIKHNVPTHSGHKTVIHKGQEAMSREKKKIKEMKKGHEESAAATATKLLEKKKNNNNQPTNQPTNREYLTCLLLRNRIRRQDSGKMAKGRENP
jgi:hypothetical protein